MRWCRSVTSTPAPAASSPKPYSATCGLKCFAVNPYSGEHFWTHALPLARPVEDLVPVQFGARVDAVAGYARFVHDAVGVLLQFERRVGRHQPVASVDTVELVDRGGAGRCNPVELSTAGETPVVSAERVHPRGHARGSLRSGRVQSAYVLSESSIGRLPTTAIAALGLLVPEQSTWLGRSEVVTGPPEPVVGFVPLHRAFSSADGRERVVFLAVTPMRGGPTQTERAIVVVIEVALQYPVGEPHLAAIRQF